MYALVSQVVDALVAVAMKWPTLREFNSNQHGMANNLHKRVLYLNKNCSCTCCVANKLVFRANCCEFMKHRKDTLSPKDTYTTMCLFSHALMM